MEVKPETKIALSLVGAIVAEAIVFCFWIAGVYYEGKATARELDTVKIELKEALKDNIRFQKEIIDRLGRIETKVERK
jgi:hypothetical protein